LKIPGLSFKRTFVQEKVDGANSGMALVNGEPIIRNREHILRKGFMKDTPAKKQFASIWGWFYDHRENFETLNDLLGPVSVYGEWMIQIHGMVYDSLPDWFLAYDVYDYEAEKFLDPQLAMDALQKSGFSVVPTLKIGVSSYEELETLANDNSPFAAIPREGVYVKVSDGKWQVDRFKMVRQGDSSKAACLTIKRFAKIVWRSESKIPVSVCPWRNHVSQWLYVDRTSRCVGDCGSRGLTGCKCHWLWRFGVRRQTGTKMD
jgi:hypothetical protein